MNTITADTTLDEWRAEVGRLYDAMEYRPVVVAILRKGDGQVLFVESAKTAGIWGFPQGGVDRDEDLVEALRRELLEETGIGPEHYEVVGLRCVDQLDLSRTRDGFTKGKRYYFFLCVSTKEPPISLDRQENTAFRWISPESAASLLTTVTPQKRESLLGALRIVG